jgi:hypothetical protein
MKPKKKSAGAGSGIYRQGDVILQRVADVDVDVASSLAPAPKDARGIVLADGETSGHHHAVFGRGAKLLAFRDVARQERVLVVGRGGAEVRVVGGGSGGVDRHTPISLTPGNYRVRVQRSWDAAAEIASNVHD